MPNATSRIQVLSQTTEVIIYILFCTELQKLNMFGYLGQTPAPYIQLKFAHKQ